MKLEDRKNFVRRLLGEPLAGRLAYRFRRKKCLAAWEGIFNNQLKRKELYDHLLETVDPKVLVETGTYHGSTTEYLASSGRHVFSIESCAFNAAYAASKLSHHRDTEVICADSRAGLRQVVQEPLLQDARVFFYLDAHWGTDLPLREEIQIIFEQTQLTPVVMIDDFQVPSDPGYRYDDYGEAVGALTVDLIRSHLQSLSLSAFFPSAPSASETGAKRGTVVLVRDDDRELIESLSDQLVLWNPEARQAA